MKIKLLVDVSNTKAGEIVDAILNISSWGYFFEGSSLASINDYQFEIVKDDPIAQVETSPKFDNYNKNMIDLIRDLSLMISEIKFK